MDDDRCGNYRNGMLYAKKYMGYTIFPSNKSEIQHPL